MQCGFEDQRLRALCNSAKRLQETFGDRLALHVQRILWSLDAAPNLADVSASPPVSRRRVDKGSPSTFAVGPNGPGRIYFRADMEPEPQTLSEIERIKIYDIEGTK